MAWYMLTDVGIMTSPDEAKGNSKARKRKAPGKSAKGRPRRAPARAKKTVPLEDIPLPAVGTLGRTRRLLLAALRLWELKRGLRD